MSCLRIAPSATTGQRGYARSPRYSSQTADASMSATTPSIPTALGPSEMGQNPRTFPARGLANVTSRSTINPARIVATRAMIRDTTAGDGRGRSPPPRRAAGCLVAWWRPQFQQDPTTGGTGERGPHRRRNPRRARMCGFACALRSASVGVLRTPLKISPMARSTWRSRP